MAENNMISLKVFLRDEGVAEARRFTVDASVITSFIFMKEKLQTVFPNLRDNVFKITWKDSDGDEITIASDEDFITALTEMNTDVKVLYVTIVQNNTEPVITIEADVQDSHYQGPRIICDVCNQLITGFRYKCIQCSDYDLCSNCEHQGHHSEHLMMRVPNNDVYMPRCARKFMHHVARSIKKSAYFASKEAGRAAKYAHKFGNQGKFDTQDKNEQPQPSCSTQSTCGTQPKEQSCPFTPGESINLDDIHALGAIARQHFGPILDSLRNAPQADKDNAANDGFFMDVIRNAVDGFFGKVQEQPNHPKTEKTDSNDKKGNFQNETLMDVEGATSNVEGTTSNVEGTASGADNTQQNKDKRDPGWTFVANKSHPELASNAGSSENVPSAPTCIYHENPRIAEGLMKLHEMGFSNEGGYLTHLLERYEGNINAVVKAIIDMKI